MTDFQEPYTEAELDTVVPLPDGRRKSLRHLTRQDALSIAMSRTNADERELYQAIAIKLTHHPTFHAAYLAGAFGHRPGGAA
ncbi:hypothetical protein SAMN06295974_0333 [Plantibacter flavus]|uniref:Uncharacterized protein n=1 Tax=Plantibacter flavus TaxID=150123 RepID=A0A3N2C0T0_9MICO|nr:hypothetical protein [Plantibacter flavus]ROR81109.1 hypothetical protein EDD42_1160 [Plantibacter flavus]SMG07959.1 hypothetical protein SAMN06295974_0333 [Plantibacter flavus]